MYLKKPFFILPYGKKEWANPFLLGIVILLMAVLASACQSRASQDEISFSVFGEPAEIRAYQAIVDAFQQKHPEIKVNFTYIPEDAEYRQRLAIQFSAGDAPDVMLIDYRHVSSYAALGGLEPVGPFLEKSTVVQASDYYEAPLKAFTWDGSLWCIPQNMSSLVVYYNKNLFDKADLAYPANDWTQDDFLNAARELTVDSDGDGTIDQYGAGITPLFIRAAPFIWQNGGELVDDPQNPTRLTLDPPETRTALEWFVNLQVVEHVVPDAVAEKASSSENRFLAGTLAMYFNSRRGVPTYRTITSFEWDVVPLPAGKNFATILHSDGFCMAQSSQNKDAAWTFIEFANSIDGQTILSQTGRIVPSLKVVAESPAFLDLTQSPANSQIYLDTADHIIPISIFPGWPGIELVVNNEFSRAFYGQATLDHSIEDAQRDTAEYFNEAFDFAKAEVEENE